MSVLLEVCRSLAQAHKQHPSCALCPSPPEIAAEDALTALNVIKPTEYNG